MAEWGKYEARSTRTRIMLRVGSLLTSVDTLVKSIGTNYSSRISSHDIRIPITFFSRLAMRRPPQYARRPNLLLLSFSQFRNHRSSSSLSQPQISTAIFCAAHPRRRTHKQMRRQTIGSLAIPIICLWALPQIHA